MAQSIIPLRRRLPSPANDTSFFPTESVHDASIAKKKNDENSMTNDASVTSSSSDSKTQQQSQHLEELQIHRVSHYEDMVSKSTYESEENSGSIDDEEEDEDESLDEPEDLIGKFIVFHKIDGDDDSVESLDDLSHEEEVMSEDECKDSCDSGCEDENTSNNLHESNNIVRVPRASMIGKSYGSKQPRSFDHSSDENSEDERIEDQCSMSSDEGARGLGLALDDALSALSDESYVINEDETEADDDVSSFFNEDDDNDDHEEEEEEDHTVFETDRSTLESLNAFVTMEDELKEALCESDDENEVKECLSSESEKNEPIRRDSISIEELEEIINESSSDSGIDFSDDERNTQVQCGELNDLKDAHYEPMTKGSSFRSQQSTKRSHEDDNSIDESEDFGFTSPKRFRSSSDSDYNDDKDYEGTPESNAHLPPIPWLSIGPSMESSESEKDNDILHLHPRRPPDKLFEENQLEKELSEELCYNGNFSNNTADVVPLLTPPHQSLEEDLIEWPSNLAVDTAITEAALSFRQLSPKSLDDEEQLSTKVVSFDSTLTPRNSPSPPLDRHSGLTPKLNGISVNFYCAVHS